MTSQGIVLPLSYHSHTKKITMNKVTKFILAFGASFVFVLLMCAYKSVATFALLCALAFTLMGVVHMAYSLVKMVLNKEWWGGFWTAKFTFFRRPNSHYPKKLSYLYRTKKIFQPWETYLTKFVSFFTLPLCWWLFCFQFFSQKRIENKSVRIEIFAPFFFS